MAFGKVLANEGAPHGVLVNSLMTGLLWSEQHQKRADAKAEKENITVEEARRLMEENFNSMIPMGRMGDPDEFARLALFLASDAASYLTGTAINYDGGLCKNV